MLHITNGDSAAGTIQDAVFSGQILSWQDVLHEGPVPSGLELHALSEVRAEYLASMDWGLFDQINRMFWVRDDLLIRFREHEEIVLWFEHDLYDQLQLIQILDYFYDRERGATKLSLICIGEYPGVNPFHGLGQLSAHQMASLFPVRRPVKPAELKTAHLAWQAFTSTNPTDLEKFLSGNTSALPFLKNAMIRHLQQFPSTFNGLGRTEQQILEIISEGKKKPKEIFLADQTREEAVFMGDSVFWIYIKRLTEGHTPLLKVAEGIDFFIPDNELTMEFFAQELSLTEAGQSVLAGERDQIQINGIDRWLGGVHLIEDQQLWRWNGNKLLSET